MQNSQHVLIFFVKNLNAKITKYYGWHLSFNKKADKV
jgi:hypothetical protein